MTAIKRKTLIQRLLVHRRTGLLSPLLDRDSAGLPDGFLAAVVGTDVAGVAPDLAAALHVVAVLLRGEVGRHLEVVLHFAVTRAGRVHAAVFVAAAELGGVGGGVVAIFILRRVGAVVEDRGKEVAQKAAQCWERGRDDDEICFNLTVGLLVSRAVSKDLWSTYIQMQGMDTARV